MNWHTKEFRNDLFLYADLAIVADVFFTGLGGLLKYGPYNGEALFGLCVPGTGAVTCYVAYPVTLIVYSVFMLVVALKHAKAAPFVLMFAGMFGEFTFFLVSLDPLKPFFNPAYFQPYFFTEWFALMGLALFWLWKMGIRPRFTWVMVGWLVLDFIWAPFVPYFHTTLWSVAASDTNIALECVAVWFLFGLSGWSGNRRSEVDASGLLDRPSTGGTRRRHRGRPSPGAC